MLKLIETLDLINGDVNVYQDNSMDKDKVIIGHGPNGVWVVTSLDKINYKIINDLTIKSLDRYLKSIKEQHGKEI